MGLWLFDKAGAAIAEIAEYGSIVTTERYREHSEWSGLFSPSDYETFAAAYFAQVAGETEVYLVEKMTLKTGRRPGLEVSGRSATALLSTRTILGTKIWTAQTAGSMISDMMSAFTGSRAIAISFGTGTAVGSTFSLQRSWGDCGEIALEILAAQNLGMRSRWDGSTVKLDVFAAGDVGVNLGEKFADGSTARLITDKKSWRNFAVVLGQDGIEKWVGNVGAACSVVYGTLVGSWGNITNVDEFTMSITESAANGITATLGFADVPEGSTDIRLLLNGRYSGSAGHYIRAQVAKDGVNYTTAQEVAFNAGETQFRDVSIPLPVTGLPTTGRIRLQHVTATYNAGHSLYLNMARIAYKAPRERVDVDQSGSDERRELYVDARDLQQGELTLAQYQALLSARGSAKLADTRRLEYAEADAVSTPLHAGDVVWYDAGAFGSSFMASEVEAVYEGGSVKRTVAMGDPPATVTQSLRRFL